MSDLELSDGAKELEWLKNQENDNDPDHSDGVEEHQNYMSEHSSNKHQEEASDLELSDGMEELQMLMLEHSSKKQNEEKATSKKNKKRKTYSNEVPMDKYIFTDKNDLIKNLAAAVENESQKFVKHKKLDDNSLDNEVLNQQICTGNERKPAWVDPDDQRIKLGQVKPKTKRSLSMKHLRKNKSYKELLTSHYTRIIPQPKWASLDRKDTEEEEDEILRTVGFKNTKYNNILKPNILYFKDLKRLNRSNHCEGSITSIQFHPNSQAAIVSGDLGYANVYALDGVKNEVLHSIHFDKFPIYCAKIKPCGSKMLFSSEKSFYYVYDLLSAQEHRRPMPKGIKQIKKFQISPCGRYMAVVGYMGELHLFEVDSNELIKTFKQEDIVGDIQFTADSSRMICNSYSCDINIFSLRTQRLEHKFIDDGCIRGSVLDLSPDQCLLATGSREGVVNVYDYAQVHSTNAPLPLKRFFNLTTSISNVKFNHTSELLAMSSGMVPNAVKLAHFPSANVYSNFPNPTKIFGKVRTLEFSPSSGFLAIGSWERKVPLVRLPHFKNY